MKFVLVLDNVRSAHNVGVLLRSADGLGVAQVMACGITPYPRQDSDTRLPHVIEAAERKLAKTALGAEKSLRIRHYDKTATALNALSRQGYYLVGLEQTSAAQDLKLWKPPVQPLALVVGHEIRGVSQTAIDLLDALVMIPMRGTKESLNVAAAGSVAMYALVS